MNGMGWLAILILPLTLWLAARALSTRERFSSAAEHRLVGRRSASETSRTLLALACDWHWVTDRDYRFTRISPGFTAATGVDNGAVIGSRVWDLKYLDASERDLARYRDLLERREPASLVASRRDAHGRRVFYEMAAHPMFENDEFSGYCGVARNVTRRVEAERALTESEQRYNDVVESVNEVIFQTDEKGMLSFLNGAWERLTGHSVKRSLGKPLSDFLHPDDRRSVEDTFQKVLNGGITTCSCQTRLRTRKGEIRWIEASGKPLHGHNSHVRGVVGTLDDISSRKVAELTLRNVNHELESRVRLRTAEMEAANRELETFSYSVSHDLRAPLRTIDGFTRILEEDLGDKIDEAARSHLDRIRAATKRMAHLIDALIELARLTRQPVHKALVDMSEIALQIIDELRSEDPERVVEFEVTRELSVNADKVLLRVMLENLLRNAWKFTAGQPVARISFNVEVQGDQHVFCIEDNGAGFDMAFASNLFRPFSRLHNSAEFAGTGIGLATVQRVIERHGGTIRAEAEPGKGARFYFTL